MKLSSSVELRPCAPDFDGPFIRQLTKSNFYDIMKRTVGWDEPRHRQEPKQPKCYQMVYHNDRRVGFLYLRTEQQFLYVGTIQLLPDVRGAGIGTLLMQYVERVAIEGDYAGIRLRVFKENRARTLYERLEFGIVESHDFLI